MPESAATVAPPGNGWSNWAGNYRATAAAVQRPGSVAELAETIRAAAATGQRVKAVGSGHSFTDVALTDGVRLELTRLSGLISADLPQRLVTVRAGTRLCDLNELLAAHGLALPNLGDVDRQTISGALATGTHGTGARFGCLASFVTAFTLVTAAGETMRCSAESHPEIFNAARVGLGALGVITELTLRCADAFTLRADESPAPLDEVLANVDAYIADNDHFEFFWFPYTDRAMLKRNNRVPASEAPLSRFRHWLDDEFLSNTVYGGVCRLGRAAPRLVPAINSISARALSARSYTARSDKVFITSRRVRFLEMEYGIPRAALPEAFAALRRIIDRLPFKVQFPVEIRFAAADDIWLSHGYGRDSAYLAVHQYLGAPYEPYFRAFEEICAGLEGRPHWGKLHYRDAASLRPAYPRFDDFLAVRDKLDPDRVFANPYTDRVLGR